MFTLTLSPQQDLELRYRSATARDLLATGVRVLRDGGLSESNRDSITTTLAVGLGRLYELALGLRALSLHGRWVTRTNDADGQCPDLLSMHDEVFDFLSLAPQPTARGAGRGLSRITTDPAVPRLVAALGTYWDCAMGGPAHARRTGPAWTEVEDAVQQAPQDCELSILGGPNGEPAEYLAWRRSVQASRSAFRTDCGERLAGTVEAIWFTLGICGRDGAFGQPGRVFAAEVLPAASPRDASAAA
ncbi:hypothetical protein SAMN05216355_11559 [Actinomyces ruminicola]|uniref:Uncharacterized protein n=1 Tax=Actinomyces ruminicola TaxID=332524 RepID=A0A1H0EEK8_9ACTO|nr:hypothetical protein [Actinomyces ruminicola]SDN80741.1 hypothetical protein SAMN05216355_11559 [Actinomyces ruminicola]